MNYISPLNENELVDVLSKNDNYYILNGGTDLIVLLNDQVLNTNYSFIDISKIKELNYIVENDDYVSIGANVKFHQLEKSEIINKYFNSIVTAASEVGSKQIRNLGTIVGNICNSSPGGDFPAILHSLDAIIVVNSINGENKYSIDEFITGFRKNILKPGEYVSKIIVPKNKEYSFYQKYGLSHSRKVIIANAAIALSFNICNQKLCDVKVVFGACGEKFIESKKCSEFLVFNTKISIDEWLNLIEEELYNICSKDYADMKIGHLKACAADCLDFINDSLGGKNE